MNIYAISAFSSFQIAGASWVALLSMCGFSLVQIGVAECLFHVTSLIFEIPSGVISDVFGRKKTMILSQCFFVISTFLMMIAESTWSVYLALMLDALGYNFSSGTQEALVLFFDYNDCSITVSRMDVFSIIIVVHLICKKCILWVNNRNEKNNVVN